MRKILLSLGILFLASHAFAAGGTCPSGSIALKESTNSLVTLSALGVTSCVFVSATGVDTNTGLTESSPWLHAPGMTSCANNCSSFSMAAGIGIIFRPGDHWHLGNSGNAPYVGSAHWTISTAGNSTNPVYIGTDPNWAGGSGTRFVLDGDNGLWTSPNALPASCPTHDFSSSSGLSLAAFNIVDSMEVTGVCSGYTGIAVNPMFIGAGNSDILSRIYYHGWQVTAASTNLYGVATGGSNVIWTNGIIDGSDSPHWATGNAICTANGNWQCATGQGFYDRMFKIEYSVFRYTANHGVMIDTTSIHDNLIEFEETAPTSTMTNAQHADAFMVFSGTLQYFYNNVTRHNYATQIMYANVNSGGTLYMFNNVWYDNVRYGSGSTAADNCVNLAAQTSGGNQTLYVYNNTVDNDTDDPTGGGCQISIYGTSGGNSNGFTWTGNVNASNNHLIGYSNLASLFNTSRSAGVTITLNDNGGQVIQPTATARSQGFVQSTLPVGDFPPNNTVATIGAGVNQTSFCPTASPDSALCSSTSGGAGATSGVYSFPNETIVARPSSGAWNSGAFTPAGSGPPPTANTPTFSPAGGTYTGTQSVTISTTSAGAIICYTSNGSTPATNGTTGCTTGTLYTSTVSVSASETLKAVAGGTGYTDSAVGSAAYTILVQAATPTFSPVAGSYTNGPKLVTISTSNGSVICYNLVGAPATNGTTGCTTGTLYTGAITVPIGAETIFAVAGGTGFTDSAVASAAYAVYGNVTWANIVDTSRAIDWTNAGVQGGIPVRTTQCGNTIIASGDQTGATDVANINGQLQTCAANTFLLLGGTNSAPQTFYICGGLTFGSPQNSNPAYQKIINNVSIRGGGPMATILKTTCPGQQELSGAANAISVAGVQQWSPNQYPMDCAWTSGYAKGNTLLTLSGCNTNPAVGMIVILDQRNSSIGLSLCSATAVTVTCTTSIPHNYVANPNGTSPNCPVAGNCSHTCPDALNDCVFVGTVAGGATCANNDSLFNTGCNSVGATGSVPITAVPTSTSFQYAVSSLITPPTVGNSTAGTGFSDVDTGGVWNSNVIRAVTDETSGTNGRNCPDTFNVNTCASGEISDRSQAEVKTIVGVCTGAGTGTGAGTSACQASGQVIIDAPLYHNSWAASQAPGLWSMDCSPNSSGGSLCSAAHNAASCTGCTATSNYVHGAGIENLTIDGNNDGGSDTNSLVEFYRAYGSWVKNVRCLFGDRNCMWIRDGSAHLQFQDSYMGFGKGSASQSYGVEHFGDISDVLVANSIFQHVPTGIMYGGCFGCVSAYNYLSDDGDGNTTFSLFNMEDLNHDEDGFNLMEGNDLPFCHAANVHGTTTGSITVFRSRCRGQTPGGPLKSTNIVASEWGAFNRGATFVGNVLGWPNNTAVANAPLAIGETVYWGNLTAQGNLVYLLNRSSENGTFVPADTLVGKSFYSWGNYDVISGAVQCAGPFSTGNGITTGTAGGAFVAPEVPGAFTFLNAQAVPSSPCPSPAHPLPSSFYYSSQPNYWTTHWGTPSYPAIGPDVAKGVAGGAPDCTPLYNVSTNPNGCMSDNLPAQLAANNFAVDTNYVLPNTIITANWAAGSGGTVTWNGSFTMELADTFLVTGTNGNAWNTGPGGQQVIASSGPQRPFQPAIAQGTGGTLSGSLYVVLTRVQPAGQETHTGPGTSVTMSGGNNSITITAPLNNTTQNGGGLSAPGDAAVSYRVYAGGKGTAIPKLCLQATTAVGTNTTINTLVVPPCVNPPQVNGAIATVITSYLPVNPNNTFSTGTMTFPLVLAFDAAAAYPNAYPGSQPAMPAPSSVVFTKLSFPLNVIDAIGDVYPTPVLNIKILNDGAGTGTVTYTGGNFSSILSISGDKVK